MDRRSFMKGLGLFPAAAKQAALDIAQNFSVPKSLSAKTLLVKGAFEKTSKIKNVNYSSVDDILQRHVLKNKPSPDAESRYYDQARSLAYRQPHPEVQCLQSVSPMMRRIISIEYYYRDELRMHYVRQDAYHLSQRYWRLANWLYLRHNPYNKEQGVGGLVGASTPSPIPASSIFD